MSSIQEKKLFEARLENLRKCIEQDVYDLEVCHDVMMKGDILSQDATSNLEETSTVSTTRPRRRCHLGLRWLRQQMISERDCETASHV